MDRLEASRIRIAGAEVRVVARCTSTNAVLLAERPAQPVLLAAEEQTAGRGTRGRTWRSAPGAGATFTLMRRMRCAPRELAGLSLAVGVAAARALRALGAREIALKWPNDLQAGGRWEGAKLGGILIETRIQGGSVYAAVGIGINCRPAGGLGTRLRRRVVALDELVTPPPNRNAVIAAVGAEVLRALETFEREGMGAFAQAWRALDRYDGKRLRVRTADGRTVSGIAAGIAPSGALRLRTPGGTREVASGRIVENASRARPTAPPAAAATR